MTVFVSHSKHDKAIKQYFSQIFAHIGLKAKYMEFENLDTKYAGKEIAQIIRGSFLGENISAVIVLLGRNVQFSPSSQYTHNWINFEVGVSAGLQKPVWVFEDFNEFIPFPIPFVTDYCQYVLDRDDDVKYIGQILEEIFVKFTRIIKPVAFLQCPHTNCNAQFNYWSGMKLINCPVCRQGIQIN